jgi:hypothetical protein
VSFLLFFDFLYGLRSLIRVLLVIKLHSMYFDIEFVSKSAIYHECSHH